MIRLQYLALMGSGSRILMGAFLLLTLGPLACGRSGIRNGGADAGVSRDGIPATDAGSEALAPRPDSIVGRPDVGIESGPDVPSDPRVHLDTNADSLADSRFDAPPDIARDISVDRIPDRATEGTGDAGRDVSLEAPENDSGASEAGSETRTPELSVLAGALAGPGGMDGVGPDAQLYDPWGAALDGAGNLYVSDTSNNTIRKVVLATREVTTIAGLLGVTGGADGVGANARFHSPHGLAADGAGNLYIADSANSTIRKLALASHQVTTIAGTAGVSRHVDGRGGEAGFHFPTALTLDGAGNLFVADDYTVRRIVIDTGDVTTFAGTPGVQGHEDGTGTAARFGKPQGIVSDRAGNLYVADTTNNIIRKIVVATGVVTTIAGSGAIGAQDGIGAEARFTSPRGLVLDGAGNLLVSETYRIRRMVPATGEVSTVAIVLDTLADALGEPAEMAFDGAGALYVTDQRKQTVARLLTASGEMTTFVGRGSSRGSADGVGSAARFSSPMGLAIDHQNGVLVADSSNNVIRRIDLDSGRTTTLAGMAASGTRDGVGSEARFRNPTALTHDGQGTVFIADSGNRSVRRLELATGMVTTLAGNASANDSADGVGRQAHFLSPEGLALDGQGNLFVADSGASTIRRIVIATATVTTLAGKAGVEGSDDGDGSLARFMKPSGLACDGAGSLYVADTSNCIIRRIDLATGRTFTVAGAATHCAVIDGQEALARLQEPRGLALDSAGRLFVADRGGNTIRRIDLATGQMPNVVGHNGRWQTIPGPLPAYIASPYGLAVLPSGDLAISDSFENAILLARF